MINIKPFVCAEGDFSIDVADFLIRQANSALIERGVFKLVLSGGRTPVGIFDELVIRQEEVEWSKVELFWLDERCVPVDSDQSNFGNCKRSLINRLKVKPKYFPMYHSGKTEACANEYERVLKACCESEEFPQFDLILLGVGVDGHVASIFPNSGALNEVKRWVVSSVAPVAPLERITLTFPVINAAKNIVIIAKGKEKKWVFDAFYSEKIDKMIPVNGIERKKNIHWFLGEELK